MPYLVAFGVLALYIASTVYSTYKYIQLIPNMHLKIVFGAIVFLLFISFFLTRVLQNLPSQLVSIIYILGSYFIILSIFISIFHLATDALEFFFHKDFTMFRIIGIPAHMLFFIIIGLIRVNFPVYTYYNIETDQLDKGIKRKIVVVSDLHMGYSIGYYNNNKDIKRMVEMINAQTPDICCIVGDMIDGNVEPVIEKDLGRPLEDIHAKYGTFAVMGNHEYLGGDYQKAEEYLKSLKNIDLVIEQGRNVDKFKIIGRDDISSERVKGRKIRSIASYFDDPAIHIVLEHQPINIQESIEDGIFLHLSGHTHDGQIFPMNLITKLLFLNSYGMKTFGKTTSITTSGYGAWGPRMRLASKSEIVVINIIGTNP